MQTPRSKYPGTPSWCSEDLESVKKAVEENNRSIEQLIASFSGFQKQQQHWCSTVHNRCASLEALCEQLSGSVRTLLLSGAPQQLHKDKTAQSARVLQECVRETADFSDRRLKLLESKLDRCLSAGAVATQDAEGAVRAADGTMDTLFSFKASVEQTQQAIAAACTKVQCKEASLMTSPVAKVFQSEVTVSPVSPAARQHSRTKPTSPVATGLLPENVTPGAQAPSQHARKKPSPPATPRVQRLASVGERRRANSCESGRDASACLAQATGAVTPCLLLPPQPARPVWNTKLHLGKGHSVASLAKFH